MKSFLTKNQSFFQIREEKNEKKGNTIIIKKSAATLRMFYAFKKEIKYR